MGGGGASGRAREGEGARGGAGRECEGWVGGPELGGGLRKVEMREGSRKGEWE